ncbi:MAG: hypothetical protein J5819_08940 [Eubacterium sp.]|nr:hypothetical protein [Eubacterium sp.]
MNNESLRITKKEAVKVTHEINSVWHVRYQKKGEVLCVIETHSNNVNSPSYEYYFINHGFNDYEFTAKFPTEDRRCNRHEL